MKTSKLLILFGLSLGVFASRVPAAPLTIDGADGSDGDLIITANTNIDLSRAVTGVWSNNNSLNMGRGIYDSNKWAVVFKYSNVVIAAGATVTFSNHPSRAPVVWLVSGNVTNDGWVKLDGRGADGDLVNLPEPGPGGFRGGARPQSALGTGSGFGPGGGYIQDHGSYATYKPYGNPQILPLIGGSGGGGWTGGANGAGGGGAILIAAKEAVFVSSSGKISANGGEPNGVYSGSGGGIRLIADQIAGSGRVEASSANYPGRIRLEGNSASPSLSLNPPTVAVPPVPLIIWPADNAPTVRVVSIDGQTAPLDPRANLSAGGDDLRISTTGTNTLVLQTANFPTNGTVDVYIKPRNAQQSILQATFVSGTQNLATWQVRTPLQVSHTVIQARAVAQ
jgi:hypothetical protein